jgi:DNA-binding MarR family transcriptional regulator
VEFIDQACEKEGINSRELRTGSRRGCISQVRLQIAYQLVQDYGIPLAEVARQLRVSTSAISKAITRKTKE